MFDGKYCKAVGFMFSLAASNISMCAYVMLSLFDMQNMLIKNMRNVISLLISVLITNL